MPHKVSECRREVGRRVFRHLALHRVCQHSLLLYASNIFVGGAVRLIRLPKARGAPARPERHGLDRHAEVMA